MLSSAYPQLYSARRRCSLIVNPIASVESPHSTLSVFLNAVRVERESAKPCFIACWGFNTCLIFTHYSFISHFFIHFNFHSSVLSKFPSFAFLLITVFFFPLFIYYSFIFLFASFPSSVLSLIYFFVFLLISVINLFSYSYSFILPFFLNFPPSCSNC